MQINNRFIINYKFMITLLLCCLVSFVFPLLTVSQENRLKRDSEMLKRPEIKYTASDFRDPFTPQISIAREEEKPRIVKIEPEVRRKISEIFSFTIQGIIWNPNNPMAIVNNQVLRKGDVLLMQDTEEVTIVDIDKYSVTVGYLGEEEKILSPVGSQLGKN